MASGMETPDSISSFMPVTTLRNAGFSICSERMFSPCTIGTPAETMVDSWREKSTISLDLTDDLNGLILPIRAAIPVAWISVTSMGISRCPLRLSMAER